MYKNSSVLVSRLPNSGSRFTKSVIFYLSHVIVQLLYIPPAAGASRPLTVE